MSEIDPINMAEKLMAVGHEWAEKHAAAEWLEQSAKSVLAQISAEKLEESGSVAKADLLAKCSQKYIEHLRKSVEARKYANIARINYDGQRAFIDLIRSREASERAALR